MRFGDGIYSFDAGESGVGGDMGFEESRLDGCAPALSWALCWKRLALVLLAGVLAGTPPVLAQTGYDTATLKGTIFDQQGATVASATVTVSNAAGAGPSWRFDSRPHTPNPSASWVWCSG